MSNAGIIIQGTKDGFKTLYVSPQLPETDKMSIGYDIRLSSPSENAISKQCYGISFSPGGKVYTIYRAMYDGPRNMAVGFLGISLFIPAGQKLSGKQIQELLNELMKTYLSYTIENKLGIQPEDWSFIEVTLQKYVFEKEPNPTTFSQGEKDAAYIFYADTELPVYFKEIYQSQYKNYRQILLVNEKERHDNNILSAIKGAEDITHKVDIENPTYQLCIQDTKTITIKVENEAIEDKQEITRETKLHVEYSKLYHIPQTYTGTYEELVKTDPSIFKVDHSERKFIVKSQSLKINKKELVINVTDEDGVVKREDISITFNKKNSAESFSVPNSTIIFDGEGITQSWIIHINGRKKYASASRVIVPEDELYGSVFFELKKRKRRFPILKKLNSPGFVLLGILALIMGLVALAITTLDPPYRNDQSTTKEEVNQSPTQSQTTHSSSATFPDPNLKRAIESYVNGMDLSLNKLNDYREQLENHPDSSYNEIYTRLINAIKLRSAINSCTDKEDIQNAYTNIPGLLDPQNDLLTLIQNNFEIFSKIDNRSGLALSTIQYKINDIRDKEAKKIKADKLRNERIEQGRQLAEDAVKATRHESLDNNPKKQPNIKPKAPQIYSLEEFATLIKRIEVRDDLDKLFEEAKMSDTEKNYYNIIKDNFSKFLKIAGREDLPTTRLFIRIDLLKHQF
ncbi:hypothetical protein A4H97_16465 [Niastella yeongjuensis]|uniref:Uncharacterized protein n=1 Tax=Niastella yeongjuensis TaxID=354355 RepID=A0A1V9E1B0_9BACT|nr:hypothetical protein [Niastella yeongjuensis]OQP39814.1 hypothetical protein A4H97_16465 [Niastella yeongjuensis]SEO06362.1 hypothetical protein SAMN05660816_02040 [Niastella yeongjuensis]